MLKGLGWDGGYQDNFSNLIDSVKNPEPHEMQIEVLRDKKIASYIKRKLATV
jgi:hypothetical protein